MMNITKMGKMLKSGKFMLIFIKIWSDHKFFGFERFPIFVIFIFKLDANFLGLRPNSAYFFPDFIHFLVLFVK